METQRRHRRCAWAAAASTVAASAGSWHFVPGPRAPVLSRPSAPRAQPRTTLKILRQPLSESVNPSSRGSFQEFRQHFPLILSGSLLAGLSMVLPSLLQHHASLGEDVFLASVVMVTGYCLAEMVGMQMHCPHWEAKLHTGCNVLATLLSVYGLAVERLTRESPGLWWGILVPILYLVSNFTMSRLMAMYRGPKAYSHLFDLGQSFTLSFQGIHCLAWSSVYPELYWLALPFWYWSLKKLVETVTVLPELFGSQRCEHRSGEAFGSFGLGLDVLTLGFTFVNFAAAIADNAYMGAYTLRGPEDFFAVSRTLSDSEGWGSDHLRLALVKPAVGSLVVSMAVFLGTLVSRNRLSSAVGVPISVLLSSLGPWLVFFWHRLIDPSEPWLPEFMGTGWGSSPLLQLMGVAV